MEKFFHDIMIVVEDKYTFANIKTRLEEVGMSKNHITTAKDQKSALYALDMIQKCGRDVDLIIFDYQDQKIELEKVTILKDLEKGLAATIHKIVILDPKEIQFVKNSEQFKKSEIIFIASKELESTIKKTLHLEE